jgi:HEAT repeat protein
VPLLAARQVGVRKAAADALEQIGPGSVPALIELVQARDVERLKVSLKAMSEYSR